MKGHAGYEYIPFDGERFFTVVLLPEKGGRFPTVIFRSPYVGDTVDKTEDEVTHSVFAANEGWLNRGYAVVYQHCRGQGKSTGAFVPYIHEREDGLALREWIRRQSFYNGELFLLGGSYTASLHYETAPFEADIRGAVFEVQDAERYRLWYRGGQMRKGHANWHFALYKSKCGLNKTFDWRAFSQLPLANLSERVLGDRAEDFEQMLDAPSPEHPFWRTRFGGECTRGATNSARIPLLLTTGYNDFYVGGVFRMWEEMDGETREQSALLVSPYDHGDGYDPENGLCFPEGKRSERFGKTYSIDWCEHIRKGTPIPYKKGVITYYRTFENRWAEDFAALPVREITLSLKTGTRTFCYDPLKPFAFSGEGSFARENAPEGEWIRVCTTPLDRDVFVKGRMRAVLTVESDCPDTSFYVRVSLKTSQYTYVLRHDITSLGFQRGAYTPHTVVPLSFCFDEHAFLLKKGECLQVDIAATDDNTYISHTNRAGAYARQETAVTATNTVHLDDSYLFLPIEQGCSTNSPNFG